MYNYQAHRRERHLAARCQQMRREERRAQLSRQQSSPALVHSHKKRVEGFILAMIDKPIRVTPCPNHQHRFREEDNSKNLSANAFYIHRETQPERIKASLHRNSQLDQVPFSNTFSHCFRDLSSDGAMKYRATTHHLRIKQELDRQCLNYLPNCSSKKMDSAIRRVQKKQPSNLTELNKTISKSLLPMLHNKTYFKSVATLCSAPAHAPQPQPAHDDPDEPEPRKELPKAEQSTRQENSRDALARCGLLGGGVRVGGSGVRVGLRA